MSESTTVWNSLLMTFASVFTAPSASLFQQLVTAWVLCPGRHTVTRMIGMIEPRTRRAHDAYHRFLRAGVWSLDELWHLLAVVLIHAWVREGIVLLDLDDTLFHKSGRKVDGAGNFRDAVRSTGKRVVYALGLNLVVLTARLTAPWGGEPLGLPINIRLYRKGGPSHLDLAEEMICQVAEWFAGRRFALAADGAYASLAGRSLPRTSVTSRMRRDAALFEPPAPRRRGQRGRPRKKGRRLPTPVKLAKQRAARWNTVTVNQRGRSVERQLLARQVLWYQVCRERPVLLVVVRDPTGKQPDDFFFTTDLEATPVWVAEHYAGRWSIEDTFRNVKQFLGGEDPQTWKGPGPERAAALSFWIYSAVWAWYLSTQKDKQTWLDRPWYPAKTTPSFLDALACLRKQVWRSTIFATSDPSPIHRKNTAFLIDVLAMAA